jgi:hypothetical protein
MDTVDGDPHHDRPVDRDAAPAHAPAPAAGVRECAYRNALADAGAAVVRAMSVGPAEENAGVLLDEAERALAAARAWLRGDTVSAPARNRAASCA